MSTCRHRSKAIQLMKLLPLTLGGRLAGIGLCTELGCLVRQCGDSVRSRFEVADVAWCDNSPINSPNVDQLVFESVRITGFSVGSFLCIDLNRIDAGRDSAKTILYRTDFKQAI